MKRLMQDLGDLRGLDIVGDPRCAPAGGDASGSERVGVGAAVPLVRGLLRRPVDGRCPTAEPVPARAPLPH